MTLRDMTERIVIVVPAFNEAQTIATVVADLLPAYPQVVVVDDGSRDATATLAREAGAITLRHAINRGQGAALQTGIEFALATGADYIVTFDADGQHRAEDIAQLLAPLISGSADVAIGSRFRGLESNVPAIRRVVLRTAAMVTRVTSGVHLTDAHNGLRAFTRHAAGCIHITIDGMAHASEIIDQIYENGLRIAEVPVLIRYSEYSMKKGQSSFAAFRIAFDYVMKRLFR
jgi:glycosyltransferase involved in cell wall biosynthesis